MALIVQPGATNVSVTIRIVDSSDGTPETGVTSGTSGLDLEYRREGAVSTDITESDLSALTDAHSDGGMLHIGSGYYRLDVPDAAFASGANGVLVHGTATGMVVIGEYVQIDAYQDATLNGASMPELTAGAPTATPSLQEAIMAMYHFTVHKVLSDTHLRAHDSGGTELFKKQLTETATDLTEAAAADP